MYGGVDVYIHVFLKSAQVGDEWPAYLPAAVPPVPVGYEARWTPELVWMACRGENSWPYQDSNSDYLAVQPVASRYTDCAIPAPTTLSIAVII
jgi:hypothetical protein